jgi:hypothetical protein
MRALPQLKAGAAIWMAAMERCSPEQARLWLRERRQMWPLAARPAWEYAAVRLGEDLLEGRGAFPWERVRCSVRQAALRGERASGPRPGVTLPPPLAARPAGG